MNKTSCVHAHAPTDLHRDGQTITINHCKNRKGKILSPIGKRQCRLSWLRARDLIWILEE